MRLYLNFHSLSYLISSLITFYMIVSLHNLKDKSNAKNSVMYLYGAMFLAYVAYFFACSWFNMNAAYHRVFTIFATLSTCGFICNILLIFPTPIHERFSKKLLIFQLSTSVIVSLLFFLAANNSGVIYHFNGNHWDFNIDNVSKYLGYYIFLNVICFTILGIYLIIKRKGRDRVGMIWLNIAFFIMGFTSALINLFSRSGKLSREIYITYFCLSTIIGVFILSITYINHTTDKTTLLFKIISVSFALVLSTFASTGYLVYIKAEQHYDQIKSAQIQSILMGSKDIKHIFIEKDKEDDQEADKEKDQSDHSMISSTRRYYGFDKSGIAYIAYRGIHDNQSYLVGFDYIDYRMFVHSIFKYLILIVFVVSLIVIIGFRFFFLSSLIQPLKQLVTGVARVNNSDYNVELKVKYQDEIGFLTYAFNAMVVGLYSSRVQLEEYAEKLEETVKRKTVELIKTKDELIRSEKLASLGSLVAGVAHEINTPVGIGVTSASHLRSETQKTMNKLNENLLAKSELQRYFSIADESTEIILANLFRASELVKSFKRVAVDQSSEEQRVFVLAEYFREVLVSINHKIKNTGIKINLIIEETIEINSYPGLFYQILTNLIFNSMIHGFEVNDALVSHDLNKHRIIVIHGYITGSILNLEYSDNGKGISSEIIEKIFDPFFTTKRGSGGSGLGLSIIYNIITQSLKGQIVCESEVGVGTKFIIKIPIQAKESSV